MRSARISIAAIVMTMFILMTALIGCGGGGGTPSPTQTPTTSPTTNPTISPSPGTYVMSVAVKPAQSYVTADMSGNWTFRELLIGRPKTPIHKWITGTLTIDAGGTATMTSYLDSDGNTDVPVDAIQFLLSPAGIITMQGNQAFRGVLSADKSIAAAVMTDNSETSNNYSLSVMMKQGATYTTADLAGTWYIHQLYSGTNSDGWTHGTLTVNSNGVGTFSAMQDSSGQPVDTPASIQLAITQAGIITMNGKSEFHGVMSFDKKMVSAVMTNGSATDEWQDQAMLLLSKAGTSFQASDLNGNSNFVLLGTGPANQWIGWMSGTISVITGTGTITTYLDSNGRTENPDTLFQFVINPMTGIVTDSTDPYFHGVIGPDKDMMIFTTTIGIHS